MKRGVYGECEKPEEYMVNKLKTHGYLVKIPYYSISWLQLVVFD